MYKVAKGGAITINSFLNENDRNIAREYIIKTASTNMREAAKIGLQSLYADPKEVLEKYKDFDIVKEMQARKGAKLLWVRARAIDADVVNANGDLFSKEELLKETEIKGEKIPVYKTFEGVPIYTNHKNDDIEQAKGMVVYAEWDEKENCVYCTFFVDEEAYPDIARNIRTGVIHDVSMGASVEWGVCSVCGNKAYTERDYCEHLKKYKGKIYPETGKRAYEKNYGVKFIELSCVGDGAFESCEIQEIYDVDDVLDAATNLEKKANEISSNIVLALQDLPNNTQDRLEYENCLRVANSTAKTAIRLAQQAGTLVGGPLLAGQGANQNSTVQAVLSALGIDPASGLNILDLINLSLNFLEVAVMNMFARKDNVDLGHVGKVTKSMAELQSTMQDMIDDGIDVGSGQRPQQINQPQAQQGQPGQAQQASPMAANVGLANYSPTDSVGKIMDLSLNQNQGPQIGGGVALASSYNNLVWASKDGKREVFASTQTNSSSNKLLNLTKSILNLKENLNDQKQVQKSIDNVIRIANERSKNIKTNTPFVAGSRNQMDHFAKIASEQRKKLAAAVTIDFKVEDNAGNRVVLSTDGSITGYTNGKRTAWEPILNENQLNLMENGQGTRVAAELLNDYSKFVRTALLDVKERLDDREKQLDEVRKGESYDNLVDGVKSKNTGVNENTKEEQLKSKQTGEGQDAVKEILLGDAGLYGRRVKDDAVRETLTQLVEEVTHGVPTGILEEQLSNHRAEGSASAHEIMAATINALGRAVVSSYETPKTILRVAQTLSDEPMLPEMIGTAAAGSAMESDKSERADFFNQEMEPDNSVAAILKQLGAAVSADITAKDLSDALSVAVEEGEITKEGITRIAELLMKDAAVPEEGLDVDVTPSKNEELKSALMSAVDADADLISKDDLKSAISAMAMSSKETGTTPDEVVDSVDAMPEKQLMAAIDKAKTATATDGRLRARARREFWGVKTASTKNISDNVVGWLADYSTNFGISTRKIAKAAKRLCEEFEVAEKLVAKAVVASERTAGMTITQSKSECIRFICRAEDLDGVQPSDSNFDETFKQKAIEVLQGHGFQVDPGTFSFTDLFVSENGDVTATVSTASSKTFKTDSAESGEVGEVIEGGEDVPVIMTETARIARKERRDSVLAKYAQAMPGMGAPAPAGPAAGPVDPGLGATAPAGGDLGISSLTGGADMNESADMDAMTEPGEKKPWGSVCPVCGSDDVNISESNADCQSCGTTYKIMQSIELISMGDKGKSDMGEEPMGLGPDTGLGAATAPTETPAPAPAAPGMGPVASDIKTMVRLSATVDSDVYLKTALPAFDRKAESMLPIGMVCPSCGDREAHKVKNNTFCYKCGNYSRTSVQASKNDPSKLDVTITWID
jgi:translation initiation factor 1 (eIF-1/SUI1)